MPAKYPTAAPPLTFLRYQRKSTFSIPMSATPLALPMTSMLPPVPAHRAMSCQRRSSVPYSARSYMPMVAATRGTLSIRALATPITVAIISWPGRFSLRKTARDFSIPDLSSAPMDMSMPRKKSIPLVSSRSNAAGTFMPSLSFSPMWMASVSVHMAPSPVSMARYGGRPVSSEKTGTARRQAMPAPKTSLPRGARVLGGGRMEAAGEPEADGGSSDIWLTKKPRLPTRQTTLGRNSWVTVGPVESWWLIQSMVVVTSPMGVHTPPAFAATTTMAPKRRRSDSEGMILRRRDTMTIVTVRLLRMEDRKKVRKPITQKSCFFELTLMAFVTTLKPWWASTTSTMVEAARRKKHMSDTSASCSFNWSRTPPVASPVDWKKSAYVTHRAVLMRRATAALLNSKISSKIMPM
mmetsp:Transcript_8086/g.16879  ORF Transcript_8086/g.16879 Transcript_8086/m.16879 type:complete len:408 (-) Transcript_8086:944-2167(-)